jgi:hypothetical protein
VEIFFLVVGCVVGLVFILFSVRALLVGAASRHWPRVQGRVRQVVIETSIQSGKPDRYRARVDFEYEFNGAPHRNGEFVGSPSLERSIAAGYGSGYTPGKPLDVFVDPKRPSHSTLDPGLKLGSVVALLFGIGALSVFLWLLFG